MITDIQFTFNMLIGIGNLLKSYSYFVWAISGLVNPVLGLAKPVLLKYAGTGLSALATGLSVLWPGSSDLDFNIMTNSQIQAECGSTYHITGCQ